ncbi:MAG: hypothetical protein M3155_06135 [Actinomycetota bacterium]|nr:hypothetical protein [Actinomycetota bacterium]
MTIAICDFEESNRFQRVLDRLGASRGSLPLTEALAGYRGALEGSRPPAG